MLQVSVLNEQTKAGLDLWSSAVHADAVAKADTWLLRQTQIKAKLKSNWLPLTKLTFSAAVYCCLFHEAKRGLKRATRDVR